jgi:hypothetical protein
MPFVRLVAGLAPTRNFAVLLPAILNCALGKLWLQGPALPVLRGNCVAKSAGVVEREPVMDVERRRNFRSPVVGAREGALTVGKQELPVRLLDESAGGMAVSSEIMPLFGEGSEGILETDDGLTLRVTIVSVQQRGMVTRIGLERLEVLKEGGPRGRGVAGRLMSGRLKVAVFVLIGMAVGLGAQADPVRRQLHKVPGLSKVFSDVQEGPVAPKISNTLRERLRERFDIDLFAEDEMSSLLKLRDEQQKKIKSIIAAKNSAIRGGVPNSQQTAILYITQLAMLGVLDTEQRYRLESVVDHTIGATDLLQKLVAQYWPNAEPAELYNRLGAPALALPQVAQVLGLDEKQLKAIRTVVDQALERSEDLYRKAKKSPNESELLQSAYGQITDAHEQCLAVLRPEQLELLKKMARQ